MLRIKVTEKTAFMFITLLGIVSLFADITYRGATSITGPYLAVLGASAVVVSVVSGLGEFIGHGLRLVSGYISDKTRNYWVITIIGYSINLLAIPALAIAGRWEIAAALMIAERIGKAARTPARDAMISHASNRIGRGKGFSLHEALDKIGAVIGPLAIAGILLYKGSYRAGFAVLFIPALIALIILLAARFIYPNPDDFEISKPKADLAIPGAFWVYLIAAGLIAAAYADFPLIAYHFQKSAIVTGDVIPVLYAVAMGVDAVSALVFGRIFDKIGIPVLAIVSLISATFAPLVFLGGIEMALIGVIAWGIGIGAQESIMRAAVGNMVSSGTRGTAYGIFNTGYGILWLAAH